MNGLEETIHYQFHDQKLLRTALTHSSYANENRHKGYECNERLEFLGDAILSVTVAEYLYKNYPNMPEGEMTRIRAELVCEQSLFQVANELELGKYILLGKGEEANGGRFRTSILADAVEALLAAVYLDDGRPRASRLIHTYILSRLLSEQNVMNSDYKTMLQELVQSKNNQTLSYEIVGESGPDHNKIFNAEVKLNDSVVGTGIGKSKKEAEQAAAKYALESLRGQ